MAAALSRVYAGLCRRDRLTSKECPFWLDSLFCACDPREGSEGSGIIPVRNEYDWLLVYNFRGVIPRSRLEIEPKV
jgi:hypothetical protein